ncbi:FdtA/QdtA family cupin domain-containing protein [Flavobacteriaceae bacterium]|jgi:dTDP-4-dehydrorhamnose 3,5-epimerase-like enzyme|nr:FdtA/QdtA family cupin domain-containing protein [Flavobacteriaceae bacterium]
MNIKTVYKLDLPSVVDDRGILTSVEEHKDVPFKIKRIFYMHDIKKNRGGHAHIDTDQIIIAISGSFKLKVFDGYADDTYFLNNASEGVYTPRLTFVDFFEFSSDAVCLVLSNTYYEMKNSLRNINDYINYINKINKS